MILQKLLLPLEVSNILRISESTLKKIEIPIIKIRGSIRYSEEDVFVFLKKSKVNIQKAKLDDAWGKIQRKKIEKERIKKMVLKIENRKKYEK